MESVSPQVQEAPAQQPAASAEVVLEVEHLVKSFGENHVLQDFSLQLHRGENVVVLGKSGSGKSVLIKCIIGLLQPDSGSIRVFGEEVTGLEHQELDELRARVGFLFQSNALYDSMTVRENLLFPLRRHWINKTPAEEQAMVEEALQSVGLEQTQNMMPAELSGGMRKRIGLARTLILKPDIILYDEPTTGLDPITAREISQLILDVQARYTTSAIIISHDMNCVRITANRVALLVDGRCYQQGTYEELRHSTDPVVREFFEGAVPRA
ncbi:ABC transporter ATP-binding protein [Hymenobacter sp. BT730]|uniref:ABC transporter ATP-binding protein n=1 Tax=Hymenobacter sp. BT730 TaxID=3063332 RepID=UPI0026DEE4E2|nr:ATP-binding cassette domain-containing protein [Hymenobacter sp. BT730]